MIGRLVVAVVVFGGCHWVFPHPPPGSPAADGRESDLSGPGDRSTADRGKDGPADRVVAIELRDLAAKDLATVKDVVAAKEVIAKEAAAKEGGSPPPGCGNSLLDAGEVCDDGNLLAGDLCSPDCKLIDFGCTVDHTSKGAKGGFALDTEDFVPLCDGWVLAGDRQAKTIVLRKPTMSLVQRSYPLPAKPGRIALDRVAKILWVALTGVPKLARVELVTKKVTEVVLSHPARRLTVRAGGDLFISLDSGSLATAPIALVKAGSTSASVIASAIYPLLVFDNSREHLIVAQADLSPSSVARYKYDPATGSLAISGPSITPCTNGRALALSPDAMHLALVCAGAPYVVTDRVPENLAITQGTFQVGAYPEDAAFSPDGSELVATDRENLHLFVVATHSLSASHPVGSAVSPGLVSRVGFSTGGKIIFGLKDAATTAWLGWFAVH